MAQGDLTPQAIHRLARYSNTAWNEHRDFAYGMCQDLPSYASPDGAVYDATDWLFDTPGKLRKRGGWTTPMSNDTALTATHIGRSVNPNLATGGTVYLADARPSVGAAHVYSINTTTGAKTSVANTQTILDATQQGRPTEHLGSCLIPFWNPQGAEVMGLLGATAANHTTLAHPASASITTGSPTVTIGGGDTTGGLTVAVGQIFSAGDAGTNAYIGRVDSVVNSTSFTVYPTPSATFTPTFGAFDASWLIATAVLNPIIPNTTGSRLVISFQNRVLLINTTFDNANVFTIYPNRVVYSILPNETPSVVTAGSTGMFFLAAEGYEKNNYFDIAASSPLTSASPVGEGQCVFFSATECFRLTGTLSTQTATSSGIGIDVRRISSNLGCISDRAVQLTPRGLIFPALDGIYSYDGSQFHPLMNQRIANLWRDYIQNSNATPYGAAIVRGNHYIVTLVNKTNGNTVDTLICNLDTLAWGRLTNTPIGGGIPDVLDASISWASHIPSGNLTANNGGRPLLRLDAMFNPSSTNRTDGNTTAVAPTLKTRAYVEGDPNTKKRFKHVQIEYDMRGGSPTLAIASDTKLKTADASFTTLVTGAGSSTLSTTSAAATVAYETMKKLQKGVAIEHQFTQAGGSDSTEILGIKHGFQVMREGRS